jgi:hypothetical protein
MFSDQWSLVAEAAHDFSQKASFRLFELDDFVHFSFPVLLLECIVCFFPSNPK